MAGECLGWWRGALVWRIFLLFGWLIPEMLRNTYEPFSVFYLLLVSVAKRL